MSRWRARLGVAAVFLIGALCGGTALSLIRARSRPHHWDHGDGRVERVTAHLGRRLDLTAAQRAQVHAILLDGHRETAQVLRGVEPQLAAGLDRQQARITAILDAAQRTKYERLVTRYRTRRLERLRLGGAAAAATPDAGAPPPPAAR